MFLDLQVINYYLSVIKSVIQGKNRCVNNKSIMIGTEIRRKSRIQQIWVQYVD